MQIGKGDVLKFLNNFLPIYDRGLTAVSVEVYPPLKACPPSASSDEAGGSAGKFGGVVIE